MPLSLVTPAPRPRCFEALQDFYLAKKAALVADRTLERDDPWFQGDRRGRLLAANGLWDLLLGFFGCHGHCLSLVLDTLWLRLAWPLLSSHLWPYRSRP